MRNLGRQPGANPNVRYTGFPDCGSSGQHCRGRMKGIRKYAVGQRSVERAMGDRKRCPVESGNSESDLNSDLGAVALLC